MIDITMDMEQYDCPFIDATDDHAVAFSAVHWDFHEVARELETRMVVEGADPGALTAGLRALADHDNMRDYDLLKKRGEVAHVRTTIEETDAMAVVRANDGFITGPFYIAEGHELWHVGFDTGGAADEALSGLDRDNEFDVVSRERLDVPTAPGLVGNAGAAMTLIEGCQDLSAVERRTLEAAVDGGYFESPRDATLETLAERFDVSKPAVSKNLRRGQAKMIRRVVDALDELD